VQVELAPVEDIPEKGVKKVDFFGREVLLTKTDGKPRAIMNCCMHLGGPLEQDGDKLVCAWHQAEWDLSSGKMITGPGRPDARLMILPTKVIDGILNYVYADPA
jgi:nitrite reductase/ring-hydroxylating ferredoxin subunit